MESNQLLPASKAGALPSELSFPLRGACRLTGIAGSSRRIQESNLGNLLVGYIEWHPAGRRVMKLELFFVLIKVPYHWANPAYRMSTNRPT